MLKRELAVPKVLLVDDDGMLRDVISQMLEVIFRRKKVGLKLYVASNLDQAKMLLGTENFDLIITDLSLSGSGTADGLDVIRHARSNGNNCEWILATGNLLEGIEKEAGELNVASILQKPFTLQILEEKVSEALSL